MSPLTVLLSILAITAAAPLQDNQLNIEMEEDSPVSLDESNLAISKDNTDHRWDKTTTKDVKSSELLLSLLAREERVDTKSRNSQKDRTSKKNRKHKAIFVNYPMLPQLPLSRLPNYNLEYTDDYDLGVEQRTRGGSNRYQESNIFYIRLPPTPYMFVPGLGYISQPPKYSTAGLRPQMSYTRPPKPRPVHHQQQATNPFIKLPIDFVSNGKPTSVYQWQKKPSKKPLPADSPITNLDSLSADFVSNGKPTTIYQWQSNLKPAKRPDDALLNTLDKGPYSFNGKPTSFYLLKPDGSASARQPIRYHDYQQDSSYY